MASPNNFLGHGEGERGQHSSCITGSHLMAVDCAFHHLIFDDRLINNAVRLLIKSVHIIILYNVHFNYFSFIGLYLFIFEYVTFFFFLLSMFVYLIHSSCHPFPALYISHVPCFRKCPCFSRCFIILAVRLLVK